MKRITLFLVFFLLVFGGCERKEGGGGLVDGVYEGYSDATDNGYMKAVVTIGDNKITGVTLHGFDGLGLEKPSSYPWFPYHKLIDELPKAYVEKNDWNVDVITQATGSSVESNQAVRRSMERAQKNGDTKGKFFDGVFMGISKEAPGGWTIAWVTLKNDKITEVVLHSTTPDPDKEGEFVIKDESYPWAEYHEALVELPKRFVKANGPNVDIITGATGTSNQAKEAVENALKMAKR